MRISSKTDRIHSKARQNKWLCCLTKSILPYRKNLNNGFPLNFFAGSAATVFTVIALLIYMYNFMFMPRNEVSRCREQGAHDDSPDACLALCDCSHTTRSLNHNLKEYIDSPKPDNRTSNSKLRTTIHL